MRTPIARAVALTLLVACDQSGEAVAQPDRTQAVTQTEVQAAASETAPPPEQLPPDDPREEDTQIDPEAPAEPEVPQAPADYGLIKPPIDPPSEEALTLHGAAGYEVVAVYAKPDIEAPRLGYLRLGSRLQVTEKVEGTGCPKGWHALPNGGFACASKGLVVADKPPFLNDPPPLPDRSKALPYEY